MSNFDHTPHLFLAFLLLTLNWLFNNKYFFLLGSNVQSMERLHKIVSKVLELNAYSTVNVGALFI